MKRIFLTCIVGTLFQLQLHAQAVDRSKAPAAGPAPVINIPDAASFTLPNGLQVFVVTNTNDFDKFFNTDEDFPLLRQAKSLKLDYQNKLDSLRNNTYYDTN